MSPRRISRRNFLTGLGIGAGVLAVGGTGVVVWRDAGSEPRGAKQGGRRSLAAGSLGDGAPGRTLVLVELAGGNDGLQTVVPHADPAYRSLRPTLGVTDPIDLDGAIGFHPALVRLAERYRAGQVAIVEGVGSAEPDLSHFSSMQQWWSALDAGGAGWLGRYLDGAVGFEDPTAGVAIGRGPSPVLRGDASYSVSIADAAGLQPELPGWADSVDDLVAAWSRFVPESVGAGPLAPVYAAMRATTDARSRLATMLGDAPSDRAGGFVASMQLAARLVAADPAPRAVHVVAEGDFDTHQGLLDRHRRLMEDLDAGLAAFWADLEGAGQAARALVMTTSEFGRRPRENGTGTDHGTANAHVLVGPAVRGGRYGAPPSLTDLDGDNNLAMTTDLRSYFATVLAGWLDVDPAPIVGRHEPLPVF